MDLEVFTTAEARASMTRSTFDAAVRSGQVRRLHRNVYCRDGLEKHFVVRCAGALKACGPAAIISHRSAANLHGWALRPAREIDVTVEPRRRITRDGIVVHRLRQHGRDESTEVSGVVVTSKVQTMFDLASVLPVHELISLFRRVSDTALASGVLVTMNRTGSQGRKGLQMLRRLACALLHRHWGHVRQRVQLRLSAATPPRGTRATARRKRRGLRKVWSDRIP